MARWLALLLNRSGQHWRTSKKGSRGKGFDRERKREIEERKNSTRYWNNRATSRWSAQNKRLISKSERTKCSNIFLELANKRRTEMSLEELAKMKAADETFKKNQELKVENQRKALAEVTKDNIEMVIYYLPLLLFIEWF